MKAPPATTVAGLAAVAVPFTVYVLTAARQVTITDSGELAAAATTLGIAHPPGYPLFTLLGWALAHIMPTGTVIFRVGLLSALAAATTAFVIYRTTLRLASNPEKAIARRSSAGPPLFVAGPAVAYAALGGALLFAFALTPWSQAVVVEVYALQALLVMLCLLACARALEADADARHTWPIAAFTAGLALTNHLTAVLLLPPVLATFLLSLRSARGRVAGALAWSSLGFFLPLCLYAYLPLRSLAFPTVCWTRIDSLQAFLVHAGARQYHGLWGSQGLRLEELWRFLWHQLPEEATPILIVLAAVGLVALTRRCPRFAFVSTLALTLHVVYNLGYPIHDIALYYIPVVALLALWAAFGGVALANAANQRHRMGGSAVAAILCLGACYPLVRHWQTNDRHDDAFVACAVRDTLEPLPPSAVLFTSLWDTVSGPAIYEQNVMGLRADVLVVDYGRVAGPSFGDWLAREAPPLANACAAELWAVREATLRAERGQSDNVPEDRARLANLRRALVLAAAAQRPTYVTSDLYKHAMIRGFFLLPEGLAARLALKDQLRPVPIDLIQGPCGRVQDLRTPQEKLAWEDYRTAFRNRARLLQRHGRTEEAAAYIARAAALEN